MSDLSEFFDCHLDVVLKHPWGVVAPKGFSVRKLIVSHEMGSKRRKPVWFLSELFCKSENIILV